MQVTRKSTGAVDNDCPYQVLDYRRGRRGGMTQERLEEIQQMVEGWLDSDANDGDAEKTSVVIELLNEICGKTKVLEMRRR